MVFHKKSHLLSSFIKQCINFELLFEGTPNWIQETSRITPLDTIKHPIQTASKLKQRFEAPHDVFKGVILRPDVEAAARCVQMSLYFSLCLELISDSWTNGKEYLAPIGIITTVVPSTAK